MVPGRLLRGLAAALTALSLTAAPAFGQDDLADSIPDEDEAEEAPGAAPAPLHEVTESTTPVESPADGLAYFDEGTWTLPDGSNFDFGGPGESALMCDTDGDGLDEAVVYAAGLFRIREAAAVYLGVPGDLPVCGDWDGDGRDGLGVYRPDTSTFYLREEAAPGLPEHSFGFDPEGGQPLAGDFDGDGVDTVGLYDSENGVVRVAADAEGTAGWAGITGAPGDVLLAGDWRDRDQDLLARFRPSTGELWLSTSFGLVPDAVGQAASGGIPVAAAVAASEDEAPPLVLDDADHRPVREPEPDHTVRLAIDGDDLLVRGRMLVADTAWRLPWRATRREILDYLDHRAAQGFNGVLVSLLGHDLTEVNRDGFAPFVEAPYDELRPGYRRTITFLLDAASERGMVVGLAPAWAADHVAPGSLAEAEARRYGRQLGRYWSDTANLVWIFGGDPTSPESSTTVAVWDEMAAGLEEAGADQPITYHPAAGAVPQAVVESDWLDIVGVHAAGDAEVAVTAAGGDLPVLLIAPQYEAFDLPDFWHPAAPVSPAVVADEAQAVLDAGAGGLVYGHSSVAWWSTPEDMGSWGQRLSWFQALDAPGALALPFPPGASPAVRLSGPR